MRPGQQNNNKGGMRNRNRGNRKGPNPLTRSYESNGGDVKIRGTALHVAEKYVQLARDAQASGDRVASENYLQHAEHYYRIVAAAQAQMPQPQQIFRNDDVEDGDEEGDFNGFGNNVYTTAANQIPANQAPYQQGRPPQQGGGNWQGNNRAPYQGGGNQQPQQGGQPYSGNEMPAFIGGPGNGNGEQQPQSFEGGQQAPDYRGDGNGGQPNGGQNGQNFGGGQDQQPRGDRNFRHRRRRPYREGYQGGERGNGEPREQTPVGGAPDTGGYDAQDGE